MKAVLTLVIVLFASMNAYAKTGGPVQKFNLKIENHVEVSSPKMDIDMVGGLGVASATDQVANVNEKSVARLYKFKNSRVKKALSFKTNKNNAKLA